ncbi:uncharacterized protein K441DRAFT_109530 [Cenococcum geophilum 1.58]|uniref:uncharacterized protein n=1 Tax=Cenococcum geophilum 1.58 TaxID=794803 RepID=UPI00358E944C|nr:hypothetical protein K441DRAFT_109530 [Cenococcum geophilum 1.58]
MRLWSLSQETSVLILDRPIRQYLKPPCKLALTQKFSRVQLTLLQIHLDSHDFASLAQSNETYNALNPLVLNSNNPPRRDVALLPAGGYLVIAFKADNPGLAYAMSHCLVRI